MVWKIEVKSVAVDGALIKVQGPILDDKNKVLPEFEGKEPVYDEDGNAIMEDKIGADGKIEQRIASYSSKALLDETGEPVVDEAGKPVFEPIKVYENVQVPRTKEVFHALHVPMDNITVLMQLDDMTGDESLEICVTRLIRQLQNAEQKTVVPPSKFSLLGIVDADPRNVKARVL